MLWGGGVGKCCVVKECCGEVLWRSVVEKCCREVLWRNVAVKCCKASWRSVVDKGCREVLQRSVVEKCCGGVVLLLWSGVFFVVLCFCGCVWLCFYIGFGCASVFCLVEECCREVLERCWRRVLEKSGVEKCWGEVL